MTQTNQKDHKSTIVGLCSRPCLIHDSSTNIKQNTPKSHPPPTDDVDDRRLRTTYLFTYLPTHPLTHVATHPLTYAPTHLPTSELDVRVPGLLLSLRHRVLSRWSGDTDGDPVSSGKKIRCFSQDSHGLFLHQVYVLLHLSDL